MRNLTNRWPIPAGIRGILTGILLITIAAGSPDLQASVDTVGPRPVVDESIRQEIHDLLERFYAKGTDPGGFDSSEVADYAVDWFSDLLTESFVGRPFWPIAHRYDLGDVVSIRPEGTILMATVRTYVDSVPFHGMVAVDWIWYLRRADDGGGAGSQGGANGPWRISSLRRTQGLIEAIGSLRFIDTSSAFPPSIRDRVAADEAMILYDNRRLHRHFEENRPVFDELVARLASTGDLRMIERAGTRVRQLNEKLIDWGLAATEISEEAVAEFMATASEEAQQLMWQRLRTAEKQEAEGIRILDETLRKQGVRRSELDEVLALMTTARIRFVNTELPFRDAMLLTVAGNTEQAVGYLYTPSGELPWISPEDFFYLEEVGEGWWIYRSS